LQLAYGAVAISLAIRCAVVFAKSISANRFYQARDR